MNATNGNCIQVCMAKNDQREDEKSRHGESESGGGVCVLCMEKKEGWNWYLRLALVNGFFPAWHSRESTPDYSADNCGQVEQRGNLYLAIQSLPGAIHDTILLISPANQF